MNKECALTDQQRQLVEENHKLIYGFANKRNIDVEEFYDILAIGLCKAGRIYDKSRGIFSTLAYKCMETEYLTQARRIMNKSHINPDLLVSLESERLDLLIGDDGYVLDDTQLYVERFVQKWLSKKQRKVLDGLLRGYRDREIAEKTGYTRQYVCTIKKQVREKWTRYTALAQR